VLTNLPPTIVSVTPAQPSPVYRPPSPPVVTDDVGVAAVTLTYTKTARQVTKHPHTRRKNPN